MEVKGATLLYTLAGLMITFAGFSTLLLALRPAAGARLSLLDRYLAKTVMTHIFVLTAAALLPALLALYDIPEKWIWRALVCFSHCRCCLFRSPIRGGAARLSAKDRRPAYSRSSLYSAPL
jgi:hypothetical protein